MPLIIIGIPGPWRDRSEILEAIIDKSDGWLFAGGVIMNMATQRAFTLEIEEHNPHLQQAFLVTGEGRLSEAELTAIGEHRHILYVMSEDATPDIALSMLQVGAALIECGGTGVLVESSGVGHSARAWRDLSRSEDLFDIYTAFVALVVGSDSFYSCGMHNFGLPDCRVSNHLTAEEAADLLNNFNLYMLAQSPELDSGQTLSLGAEEQTYRLELDDDGEHDEESAFYNRNGIWSLVAV